jgi:hypothetical protein
MRTLTHADAMAAACLVRGLPACERRACLARILDRADAADRFRKRTGRVHPLWGDGSLMSAALQAGAVLHEPFLSDPAYLEALATVFEALLERRMRTATVCGIVAFPAGDPVLS